MNALRTLENSFTSVAALDEIPPHAGARLGITAHTLSNHE